MSTKVVLHIGTHRTGSTSIQQFLRREDDGLLAGVGARFPEGAIRPNNHVELQIIAMRPERRPERSRLRHAYLLSPDWLHSTAQGIRAEIARGGTLVYSAESLSYLRFDDEVERLMALFDDAELEVVMYTRNPTEFLRSFTFMMNVLGMEASSDPESTLYVDADSWLVDYKARIDLWERHLRPASMSVFDYDAVMAADGSVIPVFAKVLGIEREMLSNLDRYAYATSSGLRERMRRALHEEKTGPIER